MFISSYFFRLVLLAIGLAIMPKLALSQEEFIQPIDELGFSLYISANGKQGASETDNIILGFEVSHDNQEGSVWGFVVQSDLLRTKNRAVKRSYETSLDYAKSYKDSYWGWYAGIGYEADAFQDIEKEITAIGGATLDLFKYMGKDQQINEIWSHSWNLLLGTIYTSSEDSQGFIEKGQGIIAGYVYDYESKNSYDFSQVLAYEFYPEEEDFNTIVLENSVELSFAANQNLKLEIGLDYEYYPNVSRGSENYELSYYSNIVWNF